jgi:hypothetical protein
MIRKSKLALTTVFYVPNDEEGRAFLGQVRKFLNRGANKLRVRGRNENRKQFKPQQYNIRQVVPKRMASYFAVYIDRSALGDIERTERLQMYKDLDALRREVSILRGPEVDAIDDKFRSLLNQWHRQERRLYME